MLKKYLALFSIFLLVIFSALSLYEVGGFYYCGKFGGRYLEGGECVNVSQLPYCQFNNNVYEKTGGFSFNWSVPP